MHRAIECDDALTLLSARLDGELDPARAAGLDSHIAGCAACQAAQVEFLRLQTDVRAAGTYHAPPAGLEARIVASLPAETRGDAPGWRRVFGWRSALAYATVAAVAWTLGAYTGLPGSRDESALNEQEVVATHARALMAGRAIEVASSDRHTVKPWFTGKLDFAPPVADLAVFGFPLAGARLDRLGGQAVAALVYQRRAHVIDLFVLPSKPSRRPTASAGTHRGFAWERWSKNGMDYWAVSDVAREDLAAFRAALEQVPD